ncbi:hypothetical protein HRK28_13885 [Rathayibacter sp. VKM Ac-2835]|uniref:hypothetical protein n=1 Tax=Rathayibacter sp. VKM Ac-2835 TaxID=2739043 RepID=UPI0015637CCE|nr:hypothetical protein [Rathayibacter sp. VKM Ac-2835]NRG42001.1 hypothetical protein [Rathayibacter sp. VKM Ac-2835]
MASKTTQRIVIVLASTLLLAGCTSAADIPDATTTADSGAAGSATASSTPTADADVASGPRPVPSVSLAPAPVAASGECVISALDTADGSIGDVDLEVVRDRGTREGAAGTVRTATAGTPAAYVVAAGDNPARIADRFCVSPDYLDALNSVRRDGVTLTSLYGGDTLNLDPSTVLTVGDQNGRVLDNAEPEPLPAQAG